MKRCMAVLLLLFCLSEADHEAQAGPAGTLVQQPDLLWDELKGLRDMVVEQRVQLKNMEIDSKELRDTVGEQRVQLSLVEARVSASEGESKDLRDEVLRLGATVVQQREKLSYTEARVAASEEEAKEQRDMVLRLESTVEDQRVQLSNMEGEAQEQRDMVLRLESTVEDQRVHLSNMEEEAKELRDTVVEQRLQLSNMEGEVQKQRNLVRDQPKVAFSVGLGESVSVSSDTTVVYKTVITNVGNAYNPSTGIFTSAVKGVYHFRFTASHFSTGKYVYIYMYKNGQRLIHNGAWVNGGRAYVSNGMILELEQGDTVYMRIPSGVLIDATGLNHNVFSGFLLYPM